MRLGKKLAEGFALDPEADRMQDGRAVEAEPRAVPASATAAQAEVPEEVAPPARRPARV